MVTGFTPGVGGINHLDFEPACHTSGCAATATYWFSWAMQCKCPHDGLLCGPCVDKTRAYVASEKGIIPTLCAACGLFTYGKLSELVRCVPIPAPGRRMK